MFASLLPPVVRAVILLFLYALILFVLSLGVYFLGILKYIVPIFWWQNKAEAMLNYMPVLWTDLNVFSMKLFTKLEIKLQGAEKLTKNDWYLMTSNHSSWTDVLLLYRVFNHRLPVLKFFMKSQLLWAPILGLGCWFVGYPFMKRYTKEQIEKNPKLKGKDLITTKKMCQRFKARPMTIVSFAEGTRHTEAKATRQKTPYKNLLKPRAGGLAYTLMSMNDCLHQFIDVTICYPQGKVTFWDYVTGRLRRVIIKVDVQPISEVMLGDYINDREFRVKFQEWLNELWTKKDREIERLRLEDQQ